MLRTVVVPTFDLGHLDEVAQEQFREMHIGEIFIKQGDEVLIDTRIATIEFDYAVIDLPATVKGIVDTVHVVEGERIDVEDRLVDIRLVAEFPYLSAKHRCDFCNATIRGASTILVQKLSMLPSGEVAYSGYCDSCKVATDGKL